MYNISDERRNYLMVHRKRRDYLPCVIFHQYNRTTTNGKAIKISRFNSLSDHGQSIPFNSYIQIHPIPFIPSSSHLIFSSPHRHASKVPREREKQATKCQDRVQYRDLLHPSMQKSTTTKISKRAGEAFDADRLIQSSGQIPRLTLLQIIARHKSASVALTRELRLPPAIVLEPQDGEDVALAEAELFGDRGLVQVHGASEMYDRTTVSGELPTVCNTLAALSWRWRTLGLLGASLSAVVAHGSSPTATASTSL